jgi:hypothetical protein
LRLVDLQVTDDGTGQRFHLELRFAHVDSLASLDRVLGTGVTGSARTRLRLSRTDEGEHLLETVVIPSAPDYEPPPPLAAVGSDDLYDVVLRNLADLDIRRTVTVPGEVISSNAPEVEGRTSIWTLNAANLLEIERVEMRPRILFTDAEPPQEPPER